MSIDIDGGIAGGGDEDNVTMTLTKRTVYVGGLGDNIAKEMVENAFIPFGDIVQVCHL